MDLYIYDPLGKVVEYSITTNNNVEIVEFTPTINGNYTVKVTNEYSDTFTAFGISWIQ